jgi:ribosomal protein S27AE
MTDSIDKALHNQLQADGYHPSGEIWRNQSGEVALIELGVVRKITLDEMFTLMHPAKTCATCGMAMLFNQPEFRADPANRFHCIKCGNEAA